jgi:multidrug efflux pump subunit AcrA (membrane-fusion protein)
VLAAKSPPLLWVKVPVYVGDLDAIDGKKEGSVGRLDGRPDATIRLAKPVEAPPSANPLASTVDIFFEVENSDQKLVPGQRVGVTVPLKTEENYLVVPYAAVLYDINGGTWVYESHGERTYSFRRIQISRVVGDRAVLESGPKEGTLVVTDGAAELFGTEFGVGK